MVRRVGKPVTTAPAERAHAPKKTQLKEIKTKVSSFMLDRGMEFLGSGKIPAYSDRAPSKYSKRVPDAVKDVLPQAKRAKR